MNGTVRSEAPGDVSVEDPSASPLISPEELQLAARNHGMPLEALRYDVTPVGLHYLLIHFDIPQADPSGWQVEIGGHVRNTFSVAMDELRARERVSVPVTMECAGNGRARLVPRPISQPWLNEAVGTAEWTGTPLAPLLEKAEVESGALEVVFTGADRGVQGGVEQDYERSLTLEEAMRPEVLLVYEVNGQPLPPQHGSPVRLLVPGWYGMTSVKWLRRITVITEPFQGYQQVESYRFKMTNDEPGDPVTRIYPRSLMVPPGIPVFLSRERVLNAGPVGLQGRAWSGWGSIERVEVSTDGGLTWDDAELGQAVGRFAWTPWSYRWDAPAGRHELCSRATDSVGNVQPLEQPWNVQGMTNNMVQRVPILIR